MRACTTNCKKISIYKRIGNERRSCEINYRLWCSLQARKSDLERLRQENRWLHTRINLFSPFEIHTIWDNSAIPYQRINYTRQPAFRTLSIGDIIIQWISIAYYNSVSPQYLSTVHYLLIHHIQNNILSQYNRYILYLYVLRNVMYYLASEL